MNPSVSAVFVRAVRLCGALEIAGHTGLAERLRAVAQKAALWAITSEDPAPAVKILEREIERVCGLLVAAALAG